MTARFNWENAAADQVYGAYCEVSSRNGLISQFDLYFSSFDDPNATVSEFLTSTEAGSLTALTDAGTGFAVMVAINESDDTGDYVTYYAGNLNTSDPTLIPSTTAVGFEEMTVYVSYPAASDGGDNAEIVALVDKYNPYINEGTPPADAYQNAVNSLINQALSLTPTSPNSLNFKKSRKPAVETGNTTPFEGEKTATSDVSAVTSATTVATTSTTTGTSY